MKFTTRTRGICSTCHLHIVISLNNNRFCFDFCYFFFFYIQYLLVESSSPPLFDIKTYVVSPTSRIHLLRLRFIIHTACTHATYIYVYSRIRLLHAVLGAESGRHPMRIHPRPPGLPIYRSIDRSMNSVLFLVCERAAPSRVTENVFNAL